MKQFPWQGEQKCGRFLCSLHVRIWCTGFERDIHVHREAAASVIADLLPCLHDVFSVGHGHRRLVQELSPLHEIRFHLARAIPEVLTRPDGVFLQIPAQFLCLDGTDGCD
jgi:hypothetical protein